MSLPASNERLAELYNHKYTQIVVVFPLMWKHEPGGDWFLVGILASIDDLRW